MNERSLEVLEHFYQKVIIPIKLGSLDLSVTNLTLSMFAAAFVFLGILIFLAYRPKIVPSKKQTIVEWLISFIKRYIVYNMMGREEGKKWWPLITGLFIFILANNLIGIIPGAYTPTANPLVPLVLAVIIFLTVQVSDLVKNGIRGYVRTFAPRSVPAWMYVIVFPIEVVSAIAKPFSLFIRLAANMIAGHIIIYVLLGLIIYFKNYFIAIAAVPFSVIMTIFEIFVGAIQAYIFAVLASMYIGEAVSKKD
ncbi:MAG: F0F1 ATP synthase subunit A [Actinomycetia bacterium]|nr:F0F1 ATP synthase subunit A [Actinomycetes bacterium]